MATALSKRATTVSEKGLKIIKEFEGLRLKAYKDLVGVPTIGWGTTHYEKGQAVKMTDVITLDRAEQLLRFEASAKSYVLSQSLQKNKVNLTQNQFDALGSFAYNVGIEGLLGSTLYKKLKLNPLDPSIRNEFGRWNKGHKPDGTVITIDDLTRRRKQESDLYFS